jgi:regulator of RNase E activity RraA
MREYEVRIRFQGSVTTVRVRARDASQAKALVEAQYGNQVTVLQAQPAKSL